MQVPAMHLIWCADCDRSIRDHGYSVIRGGRPLLLCAACWCAPRTAPSVLRLPSEPSCRLCGCTNRRACPGGCEWVPDPQGLGPLCSACLHQVEALLAEDWLA